MFTGLVEELGQISRIQFGSGYRMFRIRAKKVLEGTRLGDSISVNGVCQTVTAQGKDWFQVETLQESLLKTNLADVKSGDQVHLERALALGDRLGGHLVQGHVEGLGVLESISSQGQNWYGKIRLPEPLLRSCFSEGSIALDGISLTIAKIQGPTIWVNIIPQTLKETTLGSRKPGYRINVETDPLVRAASLQSAWNDGSGVLKPWNQSSNPGSKIPATNQTSRSALTKTKLQAWGY